MRLSQSPPTLLSLIALLLSSCHPTVAKPYPRDGIFARADGSFLRPRNCANPCGWSGQLCCAAGEQCFTDASGQAQCGGGGGNVGAQGAAGQWQLFTSTWVETDLVTRVTTYSSFVPQVTVAVATPTATTTWAPATTTPAHCAIPCGTACCNAGSYCAVAGQCLLEVVGADVSSSYWVGYSAPLRPTSGTVTTTTSTAGVVTATVPFQTPVATAGGVVFGTAPASTGRGLSAGAIAGIVIGTLLGIALLFLICAFLCLRGAGKKLFGGKETRIDREETYVRRSHHSGGGGGASGAWYGDRPPRTSPPPKKGGLGGMGGVLAGLGVLAAALGVKRKYDQRKAEVSSYGTGSSYTEYTGTSESES